MSVVLAAEMRALEQAAFDRGVEAGELMDQAGAGIARRLMAMVPGPGRAVAFIGKGNNGGDALVVLEELRKAGWEIGIEAGHPGQEWGVLSRQRARRLGLEAGQWPEGEKGPLVLLDGLLGIGGRGGLREPLRAMAAKMEALRRGRGALVMAMDLPSGVDADSGEAGDGAVVADVTFTVGVAKAGLLKDAAVNHVGRLVLVPLEELPMPQGGDLRVACAEGFRGLLAPREHDFHKGRAGRVGVLAGSPGMTGAGVLAASGALRGGGGVVSGFLDGEGFMTLSAPVRAEVMVRVDEDPVAAVFDSQADGLVIGPGIGRIAERQKEKLMERLAASDRPVVLDADALNLIAASGRFDLFGASSVVTPHPGEFARLAPDLAKLPREEAARRFADRHGCTLLLKGARSLVASVDGVVRWNPTGHAGMATGGQGDVLAGVCGALLAAGNAPADAAMLAAWVCGRAAERAISHGGQSEESLLAGDVLAALGGAFADWRERRR